LVRVKCIYLVFKMKQYGIRAMGMALPPVAPTDAGTAFGSFTIYILYTPTVTNITKV